MWTGGQCLAGGQTWRVGHPSSSSPRRRALRLVPPWSSLHPPFLSLPHPAESPLRPPGPGPAPAMAPSLTSRAARFPFTRLFLIKRLETGLPFHLCISFPPEPLGPHILGHVRPRVPGPPPGGCGPPALGSRWEQAFGTRGLPGPQSTGDGPLPVQPKTVPGACSPNAGWLNGPITPLCCD